MIYCICHEDFRACETRQEKTGEEPVGQKGSEQKGIDVKYFYLWRAETSCISVSGKVTELEKTRDGFGKFDKKKKEKVTSRCCNNSNTRKGLIDANSSVF